MTPAQRHLTLKIGLCLGLLGGLALAGGNAWAQAAAGTAAAAGTGTGTGASLPIVPLNAAERLTLEAGGLIPYLKQRLGRGAGVAP